MGEEESAAARHASIGSGASAGPARERVEDELAGTGHGEPRRMRIAAVRRGGPAAVTEPPPEAVSVTIRPPRTRAALPNVRAVTTAVLFPRRHMIASRMSRGPVSYEVMAEIVLAAIDVAARPELWSVLCDRIAHEIGARAFMVFAYDLERPSVPQFHCSTIAGSHIVRLVSAFRAGEDVEDHPTYAALFRARPGAALQEGELLGLRPGAALPPNGWRDRVLAASGGRARSIMRVNDHGPFLDVAVAHEGDPFSAAPPALARLSPVLGRILLRTLESARVVAALTGTHARLMALFDRLDFGVAFLTSGGRVLTANAAFRNLVADRDGLRAASGEITADDPAGAAALRRLLADAARPDTAPERLTLALARRSERLPLVLRAAPVRQGDVSAGTAVLLLVMDPEDGGRLDASGLAAFGVLSRAELEVCSLLVRGFATPGIADRRGTGIETVRDQIKSATAKLACRSRLDLVRLAMASRAPVSE